MLTTGTFEVPNAKRIKRSDFLAADDGTHVSANSSREPSESGDEFGHAEVNYGFEYEFISPANESGQRAESFRKPNPSTETAEVEADAEMDEEEPTYQFRLFNSKPQPTPGPLEGNALHQVVRISATPEPDEMIESVPLDRANFTRPNRPDSYYFTSAVPSETLTAQKSQFADVALSTSDVLSRAITTKWPSAAQPWRVINVIIENPLKGRRTPSSPFSLHSQPTPKSTCRPSKRRRILLRRQLAAKVDAQQQRKLADEADKEKRTRRNREKKVKRKEREKRKKADAAAATSLAKPGLDSVPP